MQSYVQTFFSAFGIYAASLWNELTFQGGPWYVNFIYFLTALSVLVWLLEILVPWRRSQSWLRKDFWLDGFYMFFNFFIFKLLIFAAVSAVAARAATALAGGDIRSLALFNAAALPWAAQLVLLFVILDAVQWGVHVLLHRLPVLWTFHKVHHSVEQMGFAAHLRFHWMENILYTPVKYLTVALIGGFSIRDAFIVYYIATAIGHINHANLNISYGPFKYILNNPVMHIWHHALHIPKPHRYGVNFGISLSIWDYLFRTAAIPGDGRDIALGFPKMDRFPKTLPGQMIYPWIRPSSPRQ